MITEQAISDWKWLAERLKGIIDMLPELESVQSLENKIAEKELHLEAKKKEYDEKVEDIKKLLRDQEDLKLTAKEIKENASDEADGIIKAAKKSAEDIITKAQNRSNEILDALIAQKSEKEKEISTLEKRRAVVTSELSVQEQRLLNVKAKLDNLKASI